MNDRPGTLRDTGTPQLDVRDALARTLEATGDGIVLADQHGRLVYANEAFCQLSGYSAEELRALDDAIALAAPEEREVLRERARRRAAGLAVPNRYRTALLHKSGRRVDVELDVTDFTTADGQTLTAVLIRDITDRLRMAESLYESELRFRTLAESLGATVFIYQDGRFLYVNPAAEALTGYSREALLDCDALTLLVPSARSELERERDRLGQQARQGPVRFETRLLTREGEERWVDVTLAVVELGQRPAFVGWAADITTRRRTERLLRNLAEGVSAKTGEAFFSSMVQHLAEALEVDYALVGELADAEGSQVRTLAVWGDGRLAANFVYELTGTPCERAVGQTLCCYPSGAARLFPQDSLLADLGIEGYAGTPLFDSEGHPLGILCVLSRSPLCDPETTQQLLQIFAARTAAELERLRADEALRRSEARYRSLFEGAVHGIYRSTPDGRFVAVNPALVRMLGYDSAEELMGRDMARDIYEDPAERQRLIALGLEHGAWTGEARWKKKDGSPITVRLSARPVLDDHGTVEAFEAIVEDVTERRRLEAELAEARKMEAIARLAGGIAHDFNNLLTVIGGHAELLAHSFEPDDPRHDDAAQILEAAKRAALLTRQLLAFGRKQFRQPRILDLVALVAGLGEILRRLASEAVEVTLDLPARPVYVEVDRDQMEQVLVNLVANARDAMPEGGRVTVTVGEVEVHAFGHTAPTGRHAVLSVADTGPGIEPTVREHLFEPFFTTKRTGAHLGLGLATVYGIVQQSHGRIEVETAPGRGATFRIYLPRVEAPVSSADAVARPSPRAGRTVLLVEDDAAVRRFARQSLERAGYTVVDVKDAATALRLLETIEDPVDLVLSDIVMPEMTGFDLARALRTTRPELPVLFVSGYADRIEPPDELGEEVRVLHKPFTPAALVAAVDDALRGKDRGSTKEG